MTTRRAAGEAVTGKRKPSGDRMGNGETAGGERPRSKAMAIFANSHK